MRLAPVALFAYNRPDHLMRTVEGLRAARQAAQSRLWVFCDGPRRPEDRDKVARVRACAHEIQGFASVTVVERERNLGLATSITDGVTQLCREFGRVIVLEDDLLVAPSFLELMNEALDRYNDEERVMQISGYMYPGDFGEREDTLFLPMISCWGWATWKRAWDKYDPAAAGYESLRRDRALRRRFDLNGAYDYFDMLERQVTGKIDSWGIRWHLSVFMCGGLVLYPAVSKIRNIGVDGSGTHGGGTVALQRALSAESDSLCVRFPARVEADEAALARVAADMRAMRTGRMRQLFRTFIGRFVA